MKHEDFNKITIDRFAKCEQTLTKKSSLYSSLEDRLHNFKIGAKDLGTSPEKYLIHLVTKQWTTLKYIVLNDKLRDIDFSLFEELQGDIINYMVLLEGLLTDKKG